MSDKEDIDTSNKDEGSKNPEIIPEGNLLSLESNKNSGAIAEDVPRLAAEEGSGDDLRRILLEENLNNQDVIERVLTEMPKEFINTEAGTGIGDLSAKAKFSNIDDKGIEDINIDKDVKTSEINIIAENLDKSDEIDDEDMELRWDDDDDGSNLVACDDNTIAKIDDFLSEDQLLEEPSNVMTKEMSEMHSDIPKSLKYNLESDISKGKSEENIQNVDKSFREIDTTKDCESSLKLDILPEKADDEKSLEDELLIEPDLNPEAINSPEMDFDLLQEREDLNTEAINSPEMDFDVLKETDLNAEAIDSPETKYSIEESVNQDDSNILEEELMEESEMQLITQAKEILGVKILVEKPEAAEANSAMQILAAAKALTDKKSMVEEVEEILEEKSFVEKPKESGTDSAMQIIAAETLLENKSLVEEVEETLGEKNMVEKLKKSETASGKQVIAEAKSLLEEKSMVEEVEEALGEKSMVEKLEKSETPVIAEAKSLLEEKSMVVQVEETLGEKYMVEKIEKCGTASEKQVIAEAISLFEEESTVEKVEESEINTAKEQIAEAKSLIGEKIIATEVGEPEISNEIQVIAETKDILENKSIEKEVGKPEISSEMHIDETIEILGEESMIEPKKLTGSIKINLLKKVTKDTHAKEFPENIIEKDQLFAESQSTAKAKTATFKMPSFTDVILSEESDDVILEKKLLKEANSKVETSVAISEKDTESYIKIREKEVPINNEEDALLEDKLLENTETVEKIPESDVRMEIDDDKERELLKDDDCQDDSCTPMDVDVPDQSIEDQAKIEDKIVDQSMDDQPDIENKGTARSNDAEKQTDVEKVNIDESETEEVKSTGQSDDQPKTNEKVVDRLIEETNETVQVIKNIPSEDEAHIDENVEQVIDDENKMEENDKEQLVVETNTEQITKSPEETVSKTSNEITEQLQKLITENTTHETEIKDKIEPETTKEITESVNKDTNLDKHENIKEAVDPVTSLDKKDEVVEVSFKNSSMILEDSPVPIKSDHGLHKPDVMLEIPTQELIDIDDTDLSMNFDQSDVMVNLNDVYDETEHEKSVDETDDTLQEKSEDQITDVDTVKEKSVDQTIAGDDTVHEKSVDQKAVVTETNATEDVTVQEKPVDQKDIGAGSTVSEVQKDNDIVESDKQVEETVVEATIEENMDKMFADDELDIAKEVPESIASTSQAQPPLEKPPPPTQMTPDAPDEVAEISDSLGLLAETTGRMMEDDDDDDSDHYESSNQISAEQSEDSNPAALDTEPAQQEDQDQETPDPKDEEFMYMVCDSTSQDKNEDMDVEDAFGTVELQAESVSEMNEEAQSAIAALLNADNPDIEQDEEEQEPAEADQMDIETVKLSDTSDNEVDIEPTEVQTAAEPSKEGEDEHQKRSPSKSPRNTDFSPKKSPKLASPSKHSPSKLKNLAISNQGAKSLLSIVDLEESSSSDDDIQEVQRQTETADDKPPSPEPGFEVTNVNIPTGIEIMCTSGGSTSEITTKEGEVVISGVPKPPPHKPARLNISEVSIKTVSVEQMVIPETMMNDQTQTQSKPKLSLEIFSLDSDDEECAANDPQEMTAAEMEKARETFKCINYCCKSEGKEPLIVADASVVAYYDAGRKRRSMVCQPCADVVADRTKNLIQGIKDLTPLLQLDMSKFSQDLVEISDSESEDEDMTTDEPKETIGEKGAKFLEENLAKYLNDTWKKYDMDVRLKETQIMLDDEIEKLEQDSKEIDAMLNECQVATDKLRCELYATFECRRQQLPALLIHDTPTTKYIGLEKQENAPVVESIETRQNKRRLSSTSELPAKRPAIPLGYAPLDGSDKDKTVFPGPESKMDDDTDISVVKLSAEAAPAELPPPGEISRPPLRVGMPVYAMKNAFGPWLKGRVLEIQPKNPTGGNQFSLCRVKFDHKTKTNAKVLLARCIAYSEPADVRMTIGTRLIALFKDTNKRESYYSGVVAEIPNPVNNYRYLVFFDDGYAQYVQHQYTRLVCESSPLVWEEVHPFSREFVREYLLAYPERPMVRLHEGQHLKTEWNGKWWSSRVTRVDASLAQVMFVGDGRREWIYRGSTRLAPLYLELRAAERHRPRPMPRSKAQPRLNMPYVEYTRSDQQEPNKPVDSTESQRLPQQQTQIEEIRQQRAVARKSTSAAPASAAPQGSLPPATDTVTSRVVEIRQQRAVARKSTSAAPASAAPQGSLPPATDTVTSRVVFYSPKNAVRPLKMVPHRCSPKCKRTDVLSLKELKSYNPLAKPLLSGWERQIVRFKGHKDVMYRAPCGRRLRNMRELHHYLRAIDSHLPVDLFDFHYTTHCLAEFMLTKFNVAKKDLSHGKENVPVPCVNYYDEALPEFCSYNTERTPTAGVPLNLDPEFLCGCDCTDDCQDKSKCACWKMTLEGARTIGLDGPNVGYVYKRLPEPLPSGIYECNSRCKCKHTCLNRVAQHPLQLKLQVFKTPNRGWGIRALNDVPKGSFLCVYAGNLLTDATANLDGLNEGDEYLAELDYIEVVEQMKEGFEEDIPEADKKLDKKELGGDNDSDEDEPSSSEDEDNASKTDKEDDDFRPGYIGLGVTEFNKHLRKREKSKRIKEESATDEKDKEKDTPKDKETKDPNAEEDCITISDDEEVREPSRFMAQTNMGANEYISKYKSVRTLFGKDEACYIMDAKVQGNIGRYLNHSCCPNVFVQNVFVDTHDPRFPWVAFFALSHIKAGTELTWNYNYDVGSVPGKVLYCYCGAPNCRGRLL